MSMLQNSKGTRQYVVKSLFTNLSPNLHLKGNHCHHLWSVFLKVASSLPTIGPLPSFYFIFFSIIFSAFLLLIQITTYTLSHSASFKIYFICWNLIEISLY